jgi:hypothetical protein
MTHGALFKRLFTRYTSNDILGFSFVPMNAGTAVFYVYGYLAGKVSNA